MDTFAFFSLPWKSFISECFRHDLLKKNENPLIEHHWHLRFGRACPKHPGENLLHFSHVSSTSLFQSNVAPAAKSVLAGLGLPDAEPAEVSVSRGHAAAYRWCPSCWQAFWASLTKETPKFSERGVIAGTHHGWQDSPLHTTVFHTAGVPAQVLFFFPRCRCFLTPCLMFQILEKKQQKPQTNPKPSMFLTLIPVRSGRRILMSCWWWDRRQIGVHFGQQWRCSPVLLVYSSIRG